MLLGSYQLLFYDPASFVRLAVVVGFALLTAITVHEFSHALVATLLGDRTAQRLGRLSLNPRRHLDPGGTAMLLVAGFGWGKPVPVNQHNLGRGPRDMALVAVAGPLSNLVLAFLLAIPVKAGLLGWSNPTLGRATYVLTGGLREGLSDIVGVVILFNLLLAVFNLVPVAPLDGAKVLGGLLPRQWLPSYSRLEQQGPLLLVGIIIVDILVGQIWGVSLLWSALGPLVRGLVSLATGF